MAHIKTNADTWCVGCSLCSLWCSVKHVNISSESASRIRIIWDHDQQLPTPCVCQQCEDPDCVSVCPCDAVTKKEYILVDEEKCTGCGACERACPYNAIHVYSEKAVVCDLCGGAPLCVRVCPVNLLEVVE